jgi:hypothetical protein
MVLFLLASSWTVPAIARYTGFADSAIKRLRADYLAWLAEQEAKSEHTF